MPMFDDVMERHPDLGIYGIGVFRVGPMTREQYVEALAKDREALYAEADTVARAAAWLEANVGLIRTPSAGSYAAKHMMEHAKGGFYVTNGVFIAAALTLGATIRYVDGSPNPLLGLSLRDLRSLDPAATGRQQ